MYEGQSPAASGQENCTVENGNTAGVLPVILKGRSTPFLLHKSGALYAFPAGGDAPRTEKALIL